MQGTALWRAIVSSFFPNAAFAWLAYLTVAGLCLLTAAIDWKRLRIPNSMTLTILGCGLVMNSLRGVWLGWLGETGPYFQLTGPFGGLVESLCFSLAGFATGFVLFFVMWQLGACGGGDVKFMAALGAWLGPLWFLSVFVGTYVAVVLLLTVWWILALIQIVPARRAFSYAPPACLSLILCLAWIWRKELLLV
jgi:Flp pilus assembly protein protease CpaA